MGALHLRACRLRSPPRLLAATDYPPGARSLWILVAMVAARSCAMAFNRWADADLDAANPRTSSRAIPAGLLSRQFVLGFTVLMALHLLWPPPQNSTASRSTSRRWCWWCCSATAT